ncbi:ABC transporter substrate-binding protein [Streptomyces sp. VRA16 Mangrove soil]|uniref:ABC transporter substrate-binding protein n=1 Tax=Streptomyces sp. VRA16 Mangrove soil TaxID=2817434 RepID=UPI001A9D923E|nr:ABC transporter substrate-binding protein [Streptomyces sp. VRA16 Mangrove soil]MBO1331249.1 ABC transporter substrate-binding protein [Streptomyces sp. VRA16 Mangrove soil]
MSSSTPPPPPEPAGPSRRTVLASAAGIVLAAPLAAACGGADSGSGGSSGTLVVNATQGQLVRNFNPFAPQPLHPTHGLLYEPLFHFNAAKAGVVHDWLGTDYRWGDDGKRLTVTLRKGVKWSDGKPFTAEDAAYTFQIAKDNKELNQYAYPLDTITAQDDHTLVLTFTESAYTKEYFLLGKSKMLPKHIWSKIPDAKKKTDINANPVATGAWKVKFVKGTTMELTARDDYYFAGLPHFRTIRYVSFSGNNAFLASVAKGKIDWAGGFIPDIKKNYLDKDPRFDLVNTPMSVAFFVPCAARGVTADVNVRKAISAALDRDFMSKSVYGGYAPATNPMALLLPNFQSVLDPSLKDTEFETGEAAVAKYLKAAGYAKSGGGWAKDGRKLSLTLTLVSGWTDYVSVGQMAKQQLKKYGIELTVKGVSVAQFTNAQSTGRFELLLSNYGYTPDPRAYYDQLLNSAVAPAIGETTNVGNYGRYRNTTIDKALSAIADTTDPAEQKPHYYTIQQEFVREMPLIPLFEQQNEIEFNGNHVTGYPTEENLYAGAAIWLDPDSGWVAARIKPAKSSK